MTFRDREQAGRLLGAKLERYRSARPVVLGLTRGGVPVAFEVARALGAELDAIVVRKVGAPGNPEYALGAVAEGGALFVRRDALREAGIGEDEVAVLAERQAVDVARRVQRYRGGRRLPELTGRTVIVVDDGVATGATARAAARAARQRGCTRVVLAAPVIAAGSLPELRTEFDDVVAVGFPDPFMAVGLWYERFGQVTDEEVLRCLERARAEREGGPAAGPAELWDGEWIEPEPAAPARAVLDEEKISIPLDGASPGSEVLEADLVVPAGACGLVLFAHGSGSTRRSPRNRFVARALQAAGLGTLLVDLLTPAEVAEDEETARLRFDVETLTGRVVAATRFIRALPRAGGLRVGTFGASTGAAAALAAAAALPGEVAAVVSRGGRPDLVPIATLARVRAPVLLVVGSRDETVLRLNRAVLPHLAHAELAVVRGATHLFEEPGALEQVARLAATWFTRRLAAPSPLWGPPAP